MNARQLRTALIDWLKEAEPLDGPSTMEDPEHVATTAAKKLGLLGYGNGDLLSRAYRVETPAECAAVLVDCLSAMPDDEPGEFLTPDDVAAMLGKSADTIRDWCRSGQLRAANTNDGPRPGWIITRENLEAFLSSRTRATTQPQPRLQQNGRRY